MTPPAPRIAVVGHTNTGKTSLMRTLLRDTDFGEVSDRPAVTRRVEGAELLVDDRPAMVLYDTPGLEDSIALREHLEALADSGRFHDDVAVVEHFLQSPEAAGPFAQEARAIRQLLASDAGICVIDAREPVLAKYRDELAILARCGRPIIPVLNFISAPEARTTEWREQLSRLNLHAVAEFDTVVFDEIGERRLFEKMRTLLDSFSPAFEALIEDRVRQRRELVASSARVLADLLIDVAAFRLSAPIDDAAARRRITERLKDAVRRREQQAVRRLLELHRFHPDDCDPSDLPIEDGRWGLDLFSPAAMRQFGVQTGTLAAAGAAAGLVIDIAAAGMTFGLGTAAGAAGGALIGAARSHGRRLFDRWRGRTELCCDDATLLLLAARQILLARALLARGHASQEKVSLSLSPQDAKRGSGSPSAKSDRSAKASSAEGAASTVGPQQITARALPPPMRLARAHPQWSTIPRDGPDPPPPRAMMSPRRDEAVTTLADTLLPHLRQPVGTTIRLN